MNSKSVNPSTGEVLKKIEGLGEKEVLGKIKAARIAGKSWREVSVERRAGLIKKLAPGCVSIMLKMLLAF